MLVSQGIQVFVIKMQLPVPDGDLPFPSAQETYICDIRKGPLLLMIPCLVRATEKAKMWCILSSEFVEGGK